MNTPVVFLVFNRPEPARRVFDAIRKARPPQLLVVCDGPRPHVPTDAQRVAEVRKIIAHGVDWPCEVLTHYAETNMGCRARVSSGLDWAFSIAQEAIILEDDCLPDPSFFPYCEALLERYRHDPKVMHIGANNFQGWRRVTKESYYFSKYNHVWGWACWRRSWQKYDHTLESWKRPEVRERISRSFDSEEEKEYWLEKFDWITQRFSEVTTWDYQWTYTCWLHEGLSISPAKNLVTNIGIGGDGTHCGDDAKKLLVPARSIKSISHPAVMQRNVEADRFTFDLVYTYREPNPYKRAYYNARIALGAAKKRLFGDRSSRGK